MFTLVYMNTITIGKVAMCNIEQQSNIICFTQCSTFNAQCYNITEGIHEFSANNIITKFMNPSSNI